MNFNHELNQVVEQMSSKETLINEISGIGASCIAEINGMFFLLIEIEIGNLERVFVIRISAALAAQLLSSGVELCEIVNRIPTSTPGTEVNLICAFVVGENVFLVFNIENDTDELILVRVPLCTIIEL
ncbi:spore coat protein [Proteiniborus sp.]|uniref:spore coat protein n=1 Tax=Proteiniborus sp. TaxID=2079015 RepID=UPI00332CAC98